jgi:hypothetical protein
MRDMISCQYPQADAAARACDPGQTSLDKTWKLRSRRLLAAAAVLLGMGHTCAAVAQSTVSAASVSADATPIHCQDRLRLDRRDDPQNAMKNIRQCSITQEISTKMENLTFWYVTLPLSAPARQDFRFDTAWKHNLGILTAQLVGLNPDKAVEFLDTGIVRGLKRGKRQDLIEKWLATHDPAVLAATKPAGVQKASNSEGTPQRSVAASNLPVIPQKTVANVAPAPAAKRHQPRRIERAQQVRRRYTRPDPYSGYDLAPMDELNPAAAPDGRYDPGTTAPSPYPSEAYHPPNAIGVSAAQMPSPYVPVQQQQTFSQPMPLQQAPPPSTALPTVYFPLVSPLIPQQIEKNIRTIAGLIDENIRTVQQTVFGAPPRP